MQALNLPTGGRGFWAWLFTITQNCSYADKRFFSNCRLNVTFTWFADWDLARGWYGPVWGLNIPLNDWFTSLINTIYPNTRIIQQPAPLVNDESNCIAPQEKKARTFVGDAGWRIIYWVVKKAKMSYWGSHYSSLYNDKDGEDDDPDKNLVRWQFHSLLGLSWLIYCNIYRLSFGFMLGSVCYCCCSALHGFIRRENEIHLRLWIEQINYTIR